MELVSVADAAKELRVSAERVRQLIRDGSLAARAVGGRWLVDGESVIRLARGRRPAGRPFSPTHAWGLLALASGERADWLSEGDVRRLRNVLAHRDVEGLHHQLRHRAELERWYIHPSLVDDFLSEEGVVVGGARASGRFRSSDAVDAYASRAVLDDLVSRYRPNRDAGEPNIIVRVVRGPWPFAPGERTAWPAVAAADLLDRADDDRAVAVAHELLERVSD
jgi:excisionase family DNA binding protein